MNKILVASELVKLAKLLEGASWTPYEGLVSCFEQLKSDLEKASLDFNKNYKESASSIQHKIPEQMKANVKNIESVLKKAVAISGASAFSAEVLQQNEEESYKKENFS